MRINGFNREFWEHAQKFIDDVYRGRVRPKLRLEEELTTQIVLNRELFHF